MRALGMDHEDVDGDYDDDDDDANDNDDNDDDEDSAEFGVIGGDGASPWNGS